MYKAFNNRQSALLLVDCTGHNGNELFNLHIVSRSPIELFMRLRSQIGPFLVNQALSFFFFFVKWLTAWVRSIECFCSVC